jgi:anti-anti-sigma factor
MSVSIKPVEVGNTVFHVVGRPTRTGSTWLWVQQELDLATVPVARAELDELFADATTPRFVLVYVGAEHFVDVRGLRLLVEAARRARSRGGDLAVVAPPRCLRLMVTRFGLGDELFLAHDARLATRWARTRVGRRA